MQRSTEKPSAGDGRAGESKNPVSQMEAAAPVEARINERIATLEEIHGRITACRVTEMEENLGLHIVAATETGLITLVEAG